MDRFHGPERYRQVASEYGTLVFRPSRWLKELGTLADLEAMSTR
jgi:hypothetical protein